MGGGAIASSSISRAESRSESADARRATTTTKRPPKEEVAREAEPPKIVPTFNEFAKSYLEISAVKNKHSSVRSKETLLRVHLLPAVGDLKLDQVTYAVIEDLKVALSKKPLANSERRWNGLPKPKNEIRNLSSKSINNCLTVLRRMLSIARKRGVIAVVPEVEWLRAPKPEFDFLTYEEADRLLAKADGEWHTMILVGLRTGLRFGELIGLRWQDVDLVAGRIMVRQNIVQGIVGTPKSGHAREVPLGDDVLKALRSHRHLRGPLVFCNLDGEVLTVGEPRYALERICRLAGLRQISWHVLHHNTESSIMPRAGQTSKPRRRQDRGRTVDGSRLSEALQEVQQPVAGPVASGPRVSRRGAGKGSLLELEIGGEVHLRRFDRLVPETKRDDGPVNAGLQELHRRGVAKYVGRHALPLQGFAAVSSGGDVLGNDVLDAVGAELASASIREERIRRGLTTGAFAEPAA